MEIRVYGPGCPRCNELEKRVRNVLAQLGVAADLQKVTDPRASADAGVLFTPGLTIDGKLVSTGKVPTEREVTTLITTALAAAEGPGGGD